MSNSASMKPRYIVSACLAGRNCTYKKSNHLNAHVKRLADAGIAISACPEVCGGLGVPRAESEIVGGCGLDVLSRRAKVMTKSGKDVSRFFRRGARAFLRKTLEAGVREAILKSSSPSCGYGVIYDGTFNGVLKKGSGVTAALLRRHGIRIHTEKGLPVEHTIIKRRRREGLENSR